MAIAMAGTHRTRLLAVIAVAAGVSACASSRTTTSLPLEPIAFADTLPIERPKEREINEVKRLILVAAGGEIGYGFSLRRMVDQKHEAINITRFDDVVNSAWFQHRIGLGGMTPDDVARGPTTVGPDTSRELTVIAGKAAGISPGFTIRDARGDRYIVKFDPKGNLHLASAAGVISSRLFNAAGYYTPEDYIIVFDSARLALDPEAEVEAAGVERRMTEEDIKDILYLTDTLPDGRYLALASKFVPGRPIGPFYFSDVRGDDPNDYYHHQYRRELRGLYVVSSWLNHVDMRYANTLDVFIDSPGYVRHYLIDFAAALGSGTIRSHKPREGSEYNFALWPSVGRILTLGFYKQGWEEAEFEEYHSSIGWFQSETFDAGKWRANWPNAAFRWVTAADGYWGAKLVAEFSDDHIRAAVKQGALPGPEVEEILVELLAGRRDKVISYWYGAVTPLERPVARLARSTQPTLELAFDDLGLSAGVWQPGHTRYSWELKDTYHEIEAAGEQQASSEMRQTLRIDLPGLNESLPGVSETEYTAMLEVEAWRNGERVGRAAVVLLRWEGTGYRVVGLSH
jgi:hypothetical protein